MFQMPFLLRACIADEGQVRSDYSSFTVNAMTADVPCVVHPCTKNHPASLIVTIHSPNVTQQSVDLIEPAAHAASLFGSQRSNIGECIPNLVI